jgi:hypothetical protein
MNMQTERHRERGENKKQMRNILLTQNSCDQCGCILLMIRCFCGTFCVHIRFYPITGPRMIWCALSLQNNLWERELKKLSTARKAKTRDEFLLTNNFLNILGDEIVIWNCRLCYLFALKFKTCWSLSRSGRIAAPVVDRVHIVVDTIGHWISGTWKGIDHFCEFIINYIFSFLLSLQSSSNFPLFFSSADLHLLVQSLNLFLQILGETNNGYIYIYIYYGLHMRKQVL